MKPTAKIIVISALLAFCSTSLANELLVPAEYPTIQSAIDAAADGDAVIVAPGTYTGLGNRDIDFLGKAITVRSTDPNDPNIVAATIIDCQGTSSNPYRGFYFHSGENAGSVLNGLTITNGYAPYGGGIYCGGSSPTIINCTITANSSEYKGGGISCRESNANIANCIISNNRSCGIWCEQSNLMITNCIINNNIGSGISCEQNSQNSTTITSCTIAGNTTGKYGGGGICCDRGNLKITNCTITDNSTRNGEGGGICFWDGNLTIANCIITGNSSYRRGGGGVFCSGNSSTIINCTITGNSAGGGGGILCSTRDSSSKITNCIITGNSAEIGGGIYCDFSNPEITNCTITGNSAEYYGGGISSSYRSNATITSCILWDNTAPDGPQISLTHDIDYDIYGSSASVSFTDVQGGQDDVYAEPNCILNWLQSNIDADPCFIQPGYWDANGLWLDGDYHLLPSSPCINTGDPNYVPEPNETDLDGLPRVIGGRIDMGAYEFNHQPVADAGPSQTVYAWLDGFANVKLDASASYDDDNDVLDYYWSWIIGGNTYEANGVNPTVKLPVGKHTIELVVDDGIDLSQPDYCTITVIKAIRGKLMITPCVLETKSHDRWILATLLIPPVLGEKVNTNEPLRLYPGGIKAKYQRFHKYGMFRCAPTLALAFFDKQQVIDALGPGQFEVSVVGRFLTGRFFFGSDTIRIIAPPPHPKPPFFWR